MFSLTVLSQCVHTTVSSCTNKTTSHKEGSGVLQSRSPALLPDCPSCPLPRLGHRPWSWALPQGSRKQQTNLTNIIPTHTQKKKQTHTHTKEKKTHTQEKNNTHTHTKEKTHTQKCLSHTPSTRHTCTLHIAFSTMTSM